MRTRPSQTRPQAAACHVPPSPPLSAGRAHGRQGALRRRQPALKCLLFPVQILCCLLCLILCLLETSAYLSYLGHVKNSVDPESGVQHVKLIFQEREAGAIRTMSSTAPGLDGCTCLRPKLFHVPGTTTVSVEIMSRNP